ncbi:hypothetical protein Tco_1186276 [Tanacetum coccineum]
MDLLLKNIDIVFKQSKFTTSRDRYVIERELKEYEDLRIKSSVQIFYKEKLNQYHLRIGKIVGIKIIIHQQHYKIEIPFKGAYECILGNKREDGI